MTHPSRNVALDPGFLASLPTSPRGYPQKIDLLRELILCIEMDEAAYRAASFLDDRILGPATRGSWFAIAKLLDASKAVQRRLPLHFIFHTGHVGSTLVSRLLDETGRILSLREPLPLRTLAAAFDQLNDGSPPLSAAKFDALLTMFLGLWGRGFPNTEQAVVKATSSAGSLAIPILERSPSSRGIYLNVRSEIYLATLLAGANASQDLLGHGPARIKRLRALTTAAFEPLPALSPGELAAMSWLVETLGQHAAVGRLPQQMLAVDFDGLLADVPATLHTILRHFGLDLDAAQIASIARSSVLTRYSKAPEFAFTPATRRQLLDEARRQHSDEISKGLSWLDALARSDAGIANVLEGPR